MKEDKKKVTVEMPQELHNAIKKLAEKDRRSVSGYIRWIMMNHVAEKLSPVWKR